MKEFSLKKKERLSSKKVIDKLFAEGKSFFVYPFKVVFLETDLLTSTPVQAAFTVSKKNFKKAVHRNYLKRRMKEVYRLNKSIIYKALADSQMAVMFIYSGKSIEEYQQLETGMIKSLKKLSQRVTKKGLSSPDKRPSTESE
ncbi:ribonuclease P protein component [Sunxiuqinia sp. A32]|uniref:ribonuclease P protein component n=1 Tax=Sunxiuqinia sp. A32 TaxID=3461496 RepID=UPI004045D915